MATVAPSRRARSSAASSAPALTGVLVREVVNFSSYWRSATFSSTVEPTIYLLAFGFGFGSLVSTIGGYDYVEFVGTGTVATAVLFSSAFPAMFGTFVKYQFQRTYDAILAAPVDTEELVTAEALWIATRAGVYGCVPMVVAMFFGLDPSWGCSPCRSSPGSRASAGRASGSPIAGFAKSFENFNYVVSAVLTPLFLVAGTFFPLDGFPEWAQVLASSTRSTSPSSSCATPSSASRVDRPRCGAPGRVRSRHLAHRSARGHEPRRGFTGPWPPPPPGWRRRSRRPRGGGRGAPARRRSTSKARAPPRRSPSPRSHPGRQRPETNASWTASTTAGSPAGVRPVARWLICLAALPAGAVAGEVERDRQKQGADPQGERVEDERLPLLPHHVDQARSGTRATSRASAGRFPARALPPPPLSPSRPPPAGGSPARRSTGSRPRGQAADAAEYGDPLTRGYGSWPKLA